MADSLVVYYQNCRGIRTKLHILYMNILANCYDIIILTETWLTPEIYNNEFIDNRYVVYRCDRDRTATNKKDGGGVLVAMLKGLRAVRLSPRSSSLHTNIEQILVKLPSSTKGKFQIIAAVYLPPKTPECVYIEYFDLLQSVLEDTNIEHFYLLGDYNLPEVEWFSSTDGTSSSAQICRGNSPVCDHLSVFMSFLNAHQFNNIKKLSGKILDLVISNDDCTILSPTDYLLQLDNHHPPLCVMITLYLPHSAMERKTIKKYNYYRANYDKINDDLKTIDWKDALNLRTVDESQHVL